MSRNQSIAVILPTRNTPQFLLRRCVDSIYQQNGDFSINLIIVNDGDEDVCIPNMDSRQIEIVVEKTPIPASGANHARNVGLRIARSFNADFVAFIDADDEWVPNHLASSLEVLSSAPDGSMSYSRLHGLHAEWTRFPTVTAVEAVFESFASTQTLVMDKTAASRCDFDADISRLQDWDFILSAISLGVSIVGNPNGGARVGLTKQSISRGANSDKRYARSVAYILLKHKQMFVSEPRASIRHLRSMFRTSWGCFVANIRLAHLKLLACGMLIYPGHVWRQRPDVISWEHEC